jgi:hypothetical protein
LARHQWIILTMLLMLCTGMLFLGEFYGTSDLSKSFDWLIKYMR